MNKDCDSDDSDIFVDFQCKTVNKLTKRDGLLLKNKVLRQTKLHLQGNVMVLGQDDIKADNEKTPTKKRKLSVESPKTSLSKKSSAKGSTPIKQSPGKSPNRTITEYFSPSRSDSAQARISVRNDLILSRCNLVVNADVLRKKRSIVNYEKADEPIVVVDIDSSEDEVFPETPPDSRTSLNKTDVPTCSFKQISSPSKIKSNEIALLKTKKVIASSSKIKENLKKTPTKKKPKVSEKKKAAASEEENLEPVSEKITLSPGIRRNNKRFKSLIDIVGPDKKNKPKKKLFSEPLFNEETLAVKAFKPSASLVLDKIPDLPDSENSNPDSDRLDADILNFIIQNAIELQLYLKTMTETHNKEFHSLITDQEVDILKKYTYLDRNSQTLFMRMFFRKPGWHRISANTYKDLSENLDGELRVLENVQYVQRDISGEDVRVKLSLLKANELTALSRSFSVGNGNLRKENLLNALLTETKSQRSVLDLFKPTSASRRLEMVATEAQKMLGPCFRINPVCQQTISRIVLLFSVFHDVESEAKRAQLQRFLLFQVLTGAVRFMTFDVMPTVVFHNREDFLEYECALLALDEMEVAFKAKTHEEFAAKAKESQWIFQRLVNDKGYCERISELPTFLRRYSAGSVHARILTMHCEHFKKKLSVTESVEILTLLQGQTLFNAGARGKWYELQCQNYTTLQMPDEAARLLISGLQDTTVNAVKKLSLTLKGQALLKVVNLFISGLQDTTVNPVKKLSLTLKGQALLKVKKYRVQDPEVRAQLEALCILGTVPDPRSVEMCARAVSGNQMGSKLVYVQNTVMGKHYSSVEEQAIYYYKQHGFTEGRHAEGFIVSTIFYLLFLDIIYTPVVGVFQSQYQERPLDMWSSSFYTSRKALIDARLEEMAYWSARSVADRIEAVFAQYKDVCCAVAWRDTITPLLLCEIVECLGVSALAHICRRFAVSPRIARSGFPDLTLWNRDTHCARFVEVKSPKDRLAPNQRLWLEYLRQGGIDCEVCNVRNIGSKLQ